MARKSAKRAGKKSEEKTVEQSMQEKATLPAFGLAEEILEMRNSECGLPNGELTASTEVQSALRNPHSEMKPADDGDDEHHLVTFLLDREEYGVPIGSVQEVIRVGRITAVPHARAHIRGVINLRGKVIPVLDLRMRLGLPGATLTKHSRIMVVENGGAVLGALVDGVSQVLRIPASSVEEPPREENEGTAYVRGIGKAGPRLVLIMDLVRALAKDDKTADGSGGGNGA